MITEEEKVGISFIAKTDKDFARALTLISPIPPRTRPAGFEELARIIIEQQVSLASAAAIWRRMINGITPFTAERLLEFTEEDLREMGLSRGKAIYCRALADHITSGKLSFDSLGSLSNDQVADALTAVKGIGRWTAEIYMISCLGRQDIWPAGDVALQVALQHLKKLENRPSIKEMDAHAEPLRPYRTLTARILWRYYADVVQVPKSKKE
ncbi:MAG: DNA-3-methyladenine glycosylase 2 family protein [Sneathiella sp.]|nr:DNA-3-methyladenine glycosylase 2 family protein [Sneathiella sp.]